MVTRITYTEFFEWQQYLGQELEIREKSDYYLAQLAAEIRRSYVKDPKKVKLGDFLLKLADPVSVKKRNDSKKTWLSFFKIKTKAE